MPTPFDEVTFSHGAPMKNRFMLAPLTNLQSLPDGTLSEDEFQWLVLRAKGGFGLTMTCASHVAPEGRGFAGQLACWDDSFLPGLTRLATALKAEGSLAIVQLHHAGRRAEKSLIDGPPLAPSDDPDVGARALSAEEVEQIIEAFIGSAERCQRAGFDGVELHGAHDYLLCEFLNASFNQRTDRYGGSQENRFRIFDEILHGIRRACGADFHVAVRLSPERFGMATRDVLDAFSRLVATGNVDMIDLSLWDTFKEAADPEYEGRPLLDLFLNLERGATRVAVAGRLSSGADVQRAIDAGADIVAIGKAAITNHDFPELLRTDPAAAMRALPVSREVLKEEGLGDTFIEYMKNWKGFVS